MTLHMQDSRQQIGKYSDNNRAIDDDSVMVAACGRGERAAQRQLYDKYSRQVFGLMSRMAGRKNAEDLTQQVFLRLLTSIQQYSGRSKFSTWLYRVATNEALQFLRTVARKRDLPIFTEPIDTNPRVQSRLEDREILDRALSKIDPELRAVFLLREAVGLSYHELALSLDIAEGTVASRLNRARRLLQDLV